MKLIPAIALILILGTTFLFAQGKGKGKGKGKGGSSGEEVAPSQSPGGGFTTTVTEINGNRITYMKPAGDASSMAPGKGKGKGRFRSATSGPTETKVLSDKALITTATSTRRTGDLIVGIELGDGIRNKVFEQMDERGVTARLVVKDDRIVEINVLISEDDSEAPIAVKPKRPPMKQ